MESGTLLHIALLRKTSKAKRKQRSLVYSQKIVKPSKIIPLADPPDDNFTLCGWTTQQNQLKQQSQHLKCKNVKLRQSLAQQNNNIITERSNVKTCEYNYRTRNRTHSYRNCHKNVPLFQQGSQRNQKKQLKQFNSQICMRPDQKFVRINIFHPQQQKVTNSFKENQSAPLFHNNQKAYIKRKDRNQKGRQKDPQFFTNYINLNNIRARKFFKI